MVRGGQLNALGKAKEMEESRAARDAQFKGIAECMLQHHKDCRDKGCDFEAEWVRRETRSRGTPRFLAVDSKIDARRHGPKGVSTWPKTHKFLNTRHKSRATGIILKVFRGAFPRLPELISFRYMHHTCTPSPLLPTVIFILLSVSPTTWTAALRVPSSHRART